MLHLRRLSFLRFVIVPVMLVALLPACYKWTEVEMTAGFQLPNPARITLTDGQQFELEDALITEDSLFGRPKGTPRPVIGQELGIRVGLTDVKKVEKAGINKDATITAIAVVGGALYFTIAMCGGDDGFVELC